MSDLMHGDYARQRNGEVISQPDPATSVILEGVHQLFVLTGFAGEYLDVLDGWRVERIESVPFEDIPEPTNDLLPQNHLLGQIIPKSLEYRRFADRLFRIAHSALLSNLKNHMCEFGKNQAFHRQPNGIS